MRNCFLLICILLSCVGLSQTNNRAVDSLERLIASLKNPDEILKEKAVLVLKYYTTGEPKKSSKLYTESMTQAASLNSEPGLAALIHTRGTLFYYESQFDSALIYFKKALELRKKIKDEVGTLKSISNIGSIYFMLTDHKKALSYYEEGLKKEAELHYNEGEFISINNLGYIYNALKMHNQALKYFRKAEKLYSKNSSAGQLIYTYDGLSNVYKDLKKTDSALIYAFKSLDIAKSMNELSELAYANINVAILLMDKKEYDPAADYLEKAIHIAEPLNDKRLQLAVYGNVAAIALRQNKPDEAFKSIEKVIALQKELHVKTDRIELAEIFAKYYYEKKEFEKAADYLQLFNQYKDSLYNLETTAQINEMQTRYESEKKEKDNQLLQVENQSYRATRNYLLIILATALITIVGALFAYRKIKSANLLLHQQQTAIVNKNEQLEAQKKEITHQKEIVDEKQKEIIDSINYARRIQFALLAGDTLLNTHLPNHFVLFKPKAVVSGDFYWASPVEDGFMYITADCTGHGVPGAFMSLLNISKLNQVVNENKITRPDLVLNNIRSEIIKALNPPGSTEESKDGMDAIVCKLNLKEMKLEYAAANNSFYIIRNQNLLVCKADKMPVGKGHNDLEAFTYNEFALQKGDTIYTFTDGFADQFGGEKGKKFKYKQFEEFLLSITHEPMQVQKQKLDHAFESWKGSLEQVDDICVIGVNIN